MGLSRNQAGHGMRISEVLKLPSSDLQDRKLVLRERKNGTKLIPVKRHRQLIDTPQMNCVSKPG